MPFYVWVGQEIVLVTICGVIIKTGLGIIYGHAVASRHRGVVKHMGVKCQARGLGIAQLVQAAIQQALQARLVHGIEAVVVITRYHISGVLLSRIPLPFVVVHVVRILALEPHILLLALF